MPAFTILADSPSPSPSPPRPSTLRRAHTMPLPLQPLKLSIPTTTITHVNKENLDPITGLPLLPAKAGKKKKPLGERALGERGSAGVGSKSKRKTPSGTKSAKRALSPSLILPSISPFGLGSFDFSVPLQGSSPFVSADTASMDIDADRIARELTVSPLADVSAAYPSSSRGWAFSLPAVSESECMDIDVCSAQREPVIDAKDVPLPPSPAHPAPEPSTPEPPLKRAKFAPSPSSDSLSYFSFPTAPTDLFTTTGISPRRSPLKRSLTSM